MRLDPWVRAQVPLKTRARTGAVDAFFPEPYGLTAREVGALNHPAPLVINTDQHAGYPPAIVRLKAEEALKENCRHRPRRKQGY
jgi:hypothetical protein